MTRDQREALVAIPVATAVGAALALAGSSPGATVGALPVFALCVAVAFVIQWLAFVPAYLLKTEHFYDLTGGLSYLTVTALALALGPTPDARSLILAALVGVWALRLSLFLFGRVRRAGKDGRFDALKTSALRFCMAWTLQGLWVSFTAAAALAALTTTARAPLGPVGVAGLAVWLLGFGIEAVADRQKSAFNADPANSGRFIDTGLWSRSRHPNYFGEIVLWVGVALLAAPVLQGWQLVTLASPLFVILLLTRVSGVPLLEQRADARWGGQAEYESYKARTPVLVPRLTRAPTP